ncbi:MAG: hypothetical protein U1E70_09210 [Acetobacteraceae bacterium]|nr:hypothetical protein [Pseudomonadota bacterium]
MSDLHDAALAAAGIVFDDVSPDEDHTVRLTPVSAVSSVNDLVWGDAVAAADRLARKAA